MTIPTQRQWLHALVVATTLSIMASTPPQAQAFDIPTPANQPQARAPTEPPKDLGPITPLPPTAYLVSEAGAG
ncbi:hypothetical protein, partial [Halothiobacillus sp.]|uniref:hypothetical protein n=1 Tax=Halothiobacillus sp. TaxID=1891311 RepID=UPI002AD3B803